MIQAFLKFIKITQDADLIDEILISIERIFEMQGTYELAEDDEQHILNQLEKFDGIGCI